MTAKKQGKKFYTPAEANAALPLVRAIVADITALAGSLRERYERLQQTRRERDNPKDAYQEEWQHMQEEFERDQERLREFEQELTKLGIHLKDYHQGLIDFPCWRDGREVYLCWKQGEPDVAHWHEVDAGFAGRQKLIADPAHPQ